jgi:tRNA-modifying protein YgfZ
MSESAVLPSLDPLAERTLLETAAGLVERSGEGVLELTGGDRQRFLHGLVSCDVKALSPGQGTFGFVTSSQGRVLAPVVVLALEDRLWLELPSATVEPIAAHLGKYVLADDVQIQPRADLALLTLVGPTAEALLSAHLSVSGEAWGHRAAELDSVPLRWVRTELLGAPAWTLWVERALAAQLAEALARDGARPVGQEALAWLRADAGIPAFGVDYGPDHFPQESGLEAVGVSYTKGCYLGQEVVARIHYRGKVNRGVQRVAFTLGPQPASGEALRLGEEEVGRLGSLGSPGQGQGLAMVHRKAAEPGTRLVGAESGVELEVIGPVAPGR